MTSSQQDNHDSCLYAQKARAAFLALASGDALGWPYENRSAIIKNGRMPMSSERGFSSWTRRTGGRFQAFEEPIGAGEYSDDTQLALCSARSLFYDDLWWDQLVQVELPTWLLYERGGGVASKRAAISWAAGTPPWKVPAVNQFYFMAGGNGVAMRILPHCVWRVRDDNFDGIARDIFRDGIATHAHPNALVGALCFGYALWCLLRRETRLGYGELVEQLLDQRKNWCEIPGTDEIEPSWWDSGKRALDEEYRFVWADSVKQMCGLLEACDSAIDKGALPVELPTLEALGCFDKKVNGSGNITAASAVFLASRFAADAENGLYFTSRLEGADTDTLASMVGALLAAINPVDWIQDLTEAVQDCTYIETIARQLCDRDGTRHLLGARVGKGQLEKFKQELFGRVERDSIQMPDRRNAMVLAVEDRKRVAKNVQARTWYLEIADGQHVYVNRVARSPIENQPKGDITQPPVSSPNGPRWRKTDVIRIGTRLLIRDLERARVFYHDVIGIPIQKESKNYINFSNSLALMKTNEPVRSLVNMSAVTISIRVHDLDAVFANVRDYGSLILEPIVARGEQRFFACQDPDGYRVEISEPI